MKDLVFFLGPSAWLQAKHNLREDDLELFVIAGWEVLLSRNGSYWLTHPQNAFMHKSVSTWPDILQFLQTDTNLVPEICTQWKSHEKYIMANNNNNNI